jgi:hypothetical protein
LRAQLRKHVDEGGELGQESAELSRLLDHTVKPVRWTSSHTSATADLIGSTTSRSECDGGSIADVTSRRVRGADPGRRPSVPDDPGESRLRPAKDHRRTLEADAGVVNIRDQCVGNLVAARVDKVVLCHEDGIAFGDRIGEALFRGEHTRGEFLFAPYLVAQAVASGLRERSRHDYRASSWAA